MTCRVGEDDVALLAQFVGDGEPFAFVVEVESAADGDRRKPVVFGCQVAVAVVDVVPQKSAVGFFAPQKSTQHLRLVCSSDTDRTVVDGLPKLIAGRKVTVVDIGSRVGEERRTANQQLETQRVCMSVGGYAAKPQWGMVDADEHFAIFAAKEGIASLLKAFSFIGLKAWLAADG